MNCRFQVFEWFVRWCACMWYCFRL